MRISKLIKFYRTINDLTVRALAEEIGVSASTMSRIERGSAVDGKTFLLVLNWLFKEV